MKAYERLLRYIEVVTTSDEQSSTTPSTPGQRDLALLLFDEMKDMGMEGVRMDASSYVYGEIPPTKGYEDKIRLGLIAHMDTAPDYSGQGVKPQLIENYDGRDVPLGSSGRVLSVSQFPHLPSLAGRTLITTDGTTLLGADNKAGIAEILTACQSILEDGSPHGRIAVAFTPDEEIGRGADGFDVKGFGCDFAFTVDGGPEGEIEYENFNGCDVLFEINGFNVHPGSSKDIMVNASLVALEINQSLPKLDTPRHTEGYEGFYHLVHMSGSVEKARLEYILRDHSMEGFEERKKTLQHIAKVVNSAYGKGTVVLTITDRYFNMSEKIKPHFHLIESAEAATKKAGVEPHINPIRGGTDGARLSYMGLPCPNLGTGGYGYHGPYEHITVEGMDAVTRIILELIRTYANEILN
jgi:tripeptide aminopeptidase